MRWLLVRHGESVANAEGWLAGHRDVPLTARGESQSRLLRAVLEETGYTRVFASDLQRAWRTAELAGAREITRVPGLRERHLGEWEGLPRHAVSMDLLLSWSLGPPGGESQQALAERVLTALAEIEPVCDGTTIVVAHGGVLRVLDGLHHRKARGILGTTRFDNTQVLDLDLPAGRWAELARDLAEDGTGPEP
ncbi:MAG: histidine phosphatase family protein, partial [Deltaproteobacteria bacterium]|nr:histidine phosphatase family protein [Deltaproteobacteria bacterium]